MQPQLNAGDRVVLSGTIYTARDAAHKRIFALLDQGEELPFPLQDAIVYYAGPTPAQQGMAVGAGGPPPGIRQTRVAPPLLVLGRGAHLGRWQMGGAGEAAMQRNGCCFFAAVGGAGALIARCIEKAEVIAFDDLGCESIKRMTVRDLPLTVAIDCHGGNLYRTGRAAYQR